MSDTTDQFLDEMFTNRGDARLDVCIGEIVRILVNADKATFAKIYAVAKTEQAMRNEESRERMSAQLHRHSTLDVIGTTGGKATVEQKG